MSKVELPEVRDTFLVQDSTWYPRLAADGDGSGLVAQAGSLLLVRTAQKIGLVKGLSEALGPWRKPLATHNPGKIVWSVPVFVDTGSSRDLTDFPVP
ncbi:hypothetical protein ACW2Q0_20730 [Nocardia sp. R16R-3T]